MVAIPETGLDAFVADLPLSTKVGQLFVYVQSGSPETTDHVDRSFFEEFRPGGVIVYSHNVENREQIAEYLADLQGLNEELGLPGSLLVTVDHRGGDSTILTPDAGGLEFPAPMAQTAIDDDLDTVGREIGAAIARDARDVGFSLNLAPYADFLERSDIEGFFFGNAMMGADPERNAALARGLTAGMGSEGLGTTYCCFPGGYGSLDADPHFATGTVDVDQATLRERFLRAPKAAIEAGVDAVMLSHWSFPAVDDAPATYSKPVIEGLLRDDLGFDGLVMTDAIGMAGAADPAGGSDEAAIRAVQAGADLVLCAGWEERCAVERAVREGRISEDRIDEAVTRVLELKRSLPAADGTTREGPIPHDRGQMAARIEQSLTWAHRPDDWEPLVGDDVLALAVCRRFLDTVGDVAGPSVTLRELPTDNPVEEVDLDTRLAHFERVSAGDERVLVGTASTEDLEFASALAERGRDVTVVHAGFVFDPAEVDPVPPLVLSYSRQPIACEKAAEVVFGEREAEGVVPVDLDL